MLSPRAGRGAGSFSSSMFRPSYYPAHPTCFSFQIRNGTNRRCDGASLPPGAVALVVNATYFPRNAGPLPITLKTFQHIDYIGVASSLLGFVLLVFALESGGTMYAWNSGPIVAALVIGNISLICFAIWQWVISNSTLCVSRSVLPLFPIHLVSHRVLGFSFL